MAFPGVSSWGAIHIVYSELQPETVFIVMQHFFTDKLFGFARQWPFLEVLQDLERDNGPGPCILLGRGFSKSPEIILH